MVYLRTGILFTNKKNCVIFFLNLHYCYFRPDAFAYHTALFSPARLFSGRSGLHQVCILPNLFWSSYVVVSV